MEDPLWEYFLEEENFNKIIELSKLDKIKPEIFQQILPKQMVEFNGRTQLCQNRHLAGGCTDKRLIKSL